MPDYQFEKQYSNYWEEIEYGSPDFYLLFSYFHKEIEGHRKTDSSKLRCSSSDDISDSHSHKCEYSGYIGFRTFLGEWGFRKEYNLLPFLKYHEFPIGFSTELHAIKNAIDSLDRGYHQELKGDQIADKYYNDWLGKNMLGSTHKYQDCGAGVGCLIALVSLALSTYLCGMLFGGDFLILLFFPCLIGAGGLMLRYQRYCREKAIDRAFNSLDYSQYRDVRQKYKFFDIKKAIEDQKAENEKETVNAAEYVPDRVKHSEPSKPSVIQDTTLEETFKEGGTIPSHTKVTPSEALDDFLVDLKNTIDSKAEDQISISETLDVEVTEYPEIEETKEQVRKSSVGEELKLEDIEAELEGAVTEATIKRAKRSKRNRDLAILVHGSSCVICDFNFDDFYGKELSRGFIHVHHTKPLAKHGEYVPNVLTDLVPICSNCHHMIHRKKAELSIEELSKTIKARSKRSIENKEHSTTGRPSSSNTERSKPAQNALLKENSESKVVVYYCPICSNPMKQPKMRHKKQGIHRVCFKCNYHCNRLGQKVKFNAQNEE